MHNGCAIRIALVLMVVMMAATVVCPAQASSGQGSATAIPALTVTSNDNAKTLAAHVGQQVVIQLAATPSTGYSWTVNGSPAPLELVESEFAARPGKTGKVGAAGTQSLRFVAKSGGTSEIVLYYHRPWEKTTHPARKFTVTVNVAQ